jgi:hypothetical protein
MNTPERKLLAAVIQQSVLDLWNYRHKSKRGIYKTRRKKGESIKFYEKRLKNIEARKSKDKRQHDSALFWFKRESQEVMSFKFCCYSLDLDPSTIKKAVLAGPPEGFNYKELEGAA